MLYYVLMHWAEGRPPSFATGARKGETLTPEDSTYIHTDLSAMRAALNKWGFVQLEPDTPPTKNFFIVSVEVEDG